MPYDGGWVWGYMKEGEQMPLFSPETTIRFLSNTGIDDSNKPNFTSNEAMTSWLIGKTKYTKTGLSYQRADERQFTSVDLNYYDLLSCDAMMWQNAGTDGMWLVANITDLEWVNPNLTRVYFKVDAYCSFCGNINWADSYCFVEREHVIDDWSGSVPVFNNMGVPESFSISPERIIASYDRSFTPDTYIILSPYDSSGNPDFNGEVKNGIYDGLNEVVTTSASEVDNYLNKIATESDAKLQNIVGVISVPSSFEHPVQSTVTIETPWSSLPTISNAKCFSSQFCNVAIESMIGGTKSYKPELLGMSGQNFSFDWIGYRIGMSCGFKVTPISYAGLGAGNIPDISFVAAATPQGAFVGNAFAQYMSVNAQSIAVRGLSAIAGVLTLAGASTATGGMAGLITAGIGTSISSNISSIFEGFRQARKNSAIIGGNTNNADTNISVASGGYGFFIRVYVPTQSQLEALDNFFDRFGYKVCKLKTPNINTRPCWNYVKTSEAHISGSIPYIYKQQLEALLNNGCTFWNVAARDIGDYSKPEENKG